jgi:TIR domain
MAHPAAFEYDLFLSHNSADKDWTRFLAQAIEADATGPALRVFLDVWYIEPGDNIVLALERALKASRRVGLVLSPKAIASDWVNSERSTAIYRDPASHKRTIIPLLHKDCEIPDLLRPLAFIDFRDPRTFGQSLSRLLWVLRGQKPVLGSKVSEEELLYREDCEAIRDYRNIFERPAFQTPCFQELCLEELSRAIRDTLAALQHGNFGIAGWGCLANSPGPKWIPHTNFFRDSRRGSRAGFRYTQNVEILRTICGVERRSP